MKVVRRVGSCNDIIKNAVKSVLSLVNEDHLRSVPDVHYFNEFVLAINLIETATSGSLRHRYNNTATLFLRKLITT